MAKTEQFSSAQVVAAIKGSSAIKQAIAERLGVHRHTVDHYLKVYPAAKQAFEDEAETQGDYAETIVYWQMREKENGVDDKGAPVKKPTKDAVEMAQWWLTKKGRRRGYGDVVVHEEIDYNIFNREEVQRIINGENEVVVYGDAIERMKQEENAKKKNGK
jgi:transposase